ncbi:hypothetical protein CROQUDRAFT_54737, partial [Cronartium quercuum f. sp. fusiforme G11]
LLYLGYIASSPQELCTAFSVPMIQLHHHLWQTTALPTNRFIDGISNYINNQCHSPLFSHAHHGKKAQHNLHKPFTYAVDLFQ